MSQIIAGTYEIKEQIGAGGGGIVYSGRHMRLEKEVVLKADKRKLSAATESLRREVDMLKNLRQTYIPQVYDFIQEGGTVYTVMDYIEGESFDKILAKGQKVSQAEVIKWACQLLEALIYLHNQPPYGILHGDIKPANIMLRPEGDICLIDYNIALALGESGAVKVGFSRGYASPEHYGADYIKSSKSAAVRRMTSVTQEDPDLTEILDTGKTSKEEDSDKENSGKENAYKEDTDKGGFRSGSGSFRSSVNIGTEGGKAIMLDARSDIYSLGATLYHILSGHRPAHDARKVIPLGPEECSPAVSAILQKAMNPQPDQRYQSAEEMREAFLGLYKDDPRAVRHRKRMIAAAGIVSVLFLTGGISAFIGQSQLKQRQQSLTLSEYSANALADGDVSGAVSYALLAVPEKKSFLSAPVTAQAQKALTDALGVYDLSDGFKALDTFGLPAAPFDLAMSPEGTRLAAVYAYEVIIYDMTENGATTVLPVQESALSDIVFVGETVVIYAGAQGVSAFDLKEGKEIWTADAATSLCLSGDGKKVAAVNRREDYAVIYRTADGTKTGKCDFGGRHLSVPENDIFADPKDSIFALNQDGSILAASFQDGSLELFDTENLQDGLVVSEASEFTHFEGGFHGDYFAYGADRGSQSVFGLVNVKEGSYVGGYDAQERFMVQADEGGIYIANGNLLVAFDPDTFEEKELAYTEQANITGFSVGGEYVLVATDDNHASFYDRGANRISEEICREPCDFVALAGSYGVLANRNEPSLRVLQLENHEDALLLSYDAGYEHEEARISMDGQTAMLFNYKQFVIYDMAGRKVSEVKLPDAGNIYDQQFIKGEEGSCLEVIWYDGTVRRYDGRDGKLLSEEKREAPEKNLYEEFYTQRYRIASSLHSPAQVYDRKTGKQVAVLEKDSYLTYVTQRGDYLITEYVSAAGERYGLLLDRDLQILAYLPKLCDITDQYLVFDYDSGNLRQCPLYSMEELIAMGEEYLAEE